MIQDYPHNTFGPSQIPSTNGTARNERVVAGNWERDEDGGPRHRHLYLQREKYKCTYKYLENPFAYFLQHISHVQLIFDRLFHVFLHQIGPISK